MLSGGLYQDGRAWSAGVAVMLGLGVWVLSGSWPSDLGHASSPAEPFPCPRPDGWWTTLQRQLASEVAAAEAAGKGWDVVFFGDSLIETLRGTTRGGNCTRCEGVPEVFARHVGSKYRAAALGIAGDQTTHLMWRLQHGGELPRAHPPRLAVLLIGTNDLGAVSDGGEAAILQAVDTTLQRLEAIVRLLLKAMPNAKVAVLALLPRGTPDPPDRYASRSNCAVPGSTAAAGTAAAPGSHAPARQLGPPKLTQPSIFSAALDRANERLRGLATRLDRAHVIDCGGPLLLEGGGSIAQDLMPDALHPSAGGYEKLFASCWGTALAELLS